MRDGIVKTILGERTHFENVDAHVYDVLTAGAELARFGVVSQSGGVIPMSPIKVSQFVMAHLATRTLSLKKIKSGWAREETNPNALLDHISRVHLQLYIQLFLLSQRLGVRLLHPLGVNLFGWQSVTGRNRIGMTKHSLILCNVLSFQSVVDSLVERARCQRRTGLGDEQEAFDGGAIVYNKR